MSDKFEFFILFLSFSGRGRGENLFAFPEENILVPHHTQFYSKTIFDAKKVNLLRYERKISRFSYFVSF